MKLVAETLNENINFERSGNPKKSLEIGNERMTSDGHYMKEATPEEITDFIEQVYSGSITGAEDQDPNEVGRKSDLQFNSVGESNGWTIYYLAIYKPMYGINDLETYVMSNGTYIYYWNLSDPYLIYSGEKGKSSVQFNDYKLHELTESWDEDGSACDFSTVVDVIDEIDELIW